MGEKKDLIQGTLDLLILRVLNGAPMHGFGIAQRIHVLSEDALRIEEGSLYPALYRMQAKGWIRAEWGLTNKNRKAKFYELTKAGRKQLGAEQETWARLAGAVGRVLESAD